MRKKSIPLILIPLFLVCSVGLQSSDFLSVQPYIATDINNMLTTAVIWSYRTVISDDPSLWNSDDSWRPDIAIDGCGNVHVVWWDETAGEWGSDWEIMYASRTAVGWSNATVISDDVTGWNDGVSGNPVIAIDGCGNVHVVWHDYTQSASEWGTDAEIMYANRTASGWSNATVISDDYTGWNDGDSMYPSIAIDGCGNMHVVWEDWTVGEWGNDREIMYANRTGALWSNATVISDDVTGWNNGFSERPDIAIDGCGNMHVVWQDWGIGYEWGNDYEIMYTNNSGAGWSNATVISDDVTGWNDGVSMYPTIAIDGCGNVHVVWQDDTIGTWGTDIEIMYAKQTLTGWSTIIISDDQTGWNNGDSQYPAIAIDGCGNVHAVWEDFTDGEWGTDTEIMYLNKSAPQTSGEQIAFIIIPLPDSSMSILSPLGLGIIGIAVATAVIISTIIAKKIK